MKKRKTGILVVALVLAVLSVPAGFLYHSVFLPLTSEEFSKAFAQFVNEPRPYGDSVSQAITSKDRDGDKRRVKLMKGGELEICGSPSEARFFRR